MRIIFILIRCKNFRKSTRTNLKSRWLLRKLSGKVKNKLWLKRAREKRVKLRKRRGLKMKIKVIRILRLRRNRKRRKLE